MAVYESLLTSPHRTLNGEEAYFFFVPVLDSCIITHYIYEALVVDSMFLLPFFSFCYILFYDIQEHMGLRSSLTLEYYKKAYTHIVEQYPYWNHSSGRDQIWVRRIVYPMYPP